MVRSLLRIEPYAVLIPLPADSHLPVGTERAPYLTAFVPSSWISRARVALISRGTLVGAPTLNESRATEGLENAFQESLQIGGIFGIVGDQVLSLPSAVILASNIV